MLNTRLRKTANDEFKKDFFKLLNGQVFRKTMKNIRNYKNIKIVKTQEKYVMKPNFKVRN